MNLSGASILLTAHHLDANLGEGWHQHTWTITAWWPAEPWRDGRAIGGALRIAAETLVTLEGGQRRIAPENWTNEAIARTLLVIGNIVQIDVDRPPQGDKPGHHARFYA